MYARKRRGSQHTLYARKKRRDENLHTIVCKKKERGETKISIHLYVRKREGGGEREKKRKKWAREKSALCKAFEGKKNWKKGGQEQQKKKTKASIHLYARRKRGGRRTSAYICMQEER